MLKYKSCQLNYIELIVSYANSVCVFVKRFGTRLLTITDYIFRMKISVTYVKLLNDFHHFELVFFKEDTTIILQSHYSRNFENVQLYFTLYTIYILKNNFCRFKCKTSSFKGFLSDFPHGRNISFRIHVSYTVCVIYNNSLVASMRQPCSILNEDGIS